MLGSALAMAYPAPGGSSFEMNEPPSGRTGPGPADGGSGIAGSVAAIREPPTASGPTGLTMVLIGATAISAGAMLSPCVEDGHVCQPSLLLCTKQEC